MRHYSLKPALILWLLFVMFILYGTLIPFDLSLDPQNIRAGLDNANLTPFFDNGRFVSMMDIVSNLLLFMVYGFLFYSAFISRVKARPWIFPVCLISSFLFSSFIEISQFLSPSRISSVTDVIVNTSGGAIGCAMGWFFYRFYRERLLRWSRAILNKRPLLLVLLIYSIILFLNFLIPFDISIQVSDVCHSIKNINLVPFSNFHSYPDYFTGAAGEMVLYLILGFLLNLSLVRYTSLSRIITIISTLIIVTIFSFIIEITQVFFISRVTDVTDLITAFSGALIGALMTTLLKKKKLVIALYASFIAYQALAPFRLLPGISSISIKNFIPFYAYWEHMTVFSFEDFLRGIILYMPLGFLISLDSDKEKSGFMPRYFIYGFLLALFLETCQLFIAGRYFDITDALLAGTGTYLGHRAYTLLHIPTVSLQRAKGDEAISRRLENNVIASGAKQSQPDSTR